ncbi:MAG: hypothetical protein DCF25_19210 [Leptolyngbya foveolarum]|uniref:Transposase DDE domain-containing protein n=1 Tax=Leptolyngbya foveolarum TaxID=47253 RepID=A0A2W4TRV2_9CYAN|nr:MAG: hypothetical protein DCF25_19210 [Leptolyngbya foveolarum]
MKQRGSLTFWLDEAVLSTGLVETPSGARGARQTYSDVAIETFETLKVVYRQAGRQTEGLLGSWFELMNVAGLRVVWGVVTGFLGVHNEAPTRKYVRG